ncbi:hypothetical protein AZE42_06299 [Rhizopogon vesiculosus]|uniref:Stalled ribosome sensor GCN1-like HEAT repeats region domain-containing protein n=1 Tax=Rhizopogon vesiculosus TaxID=180088 RepID=A0A1J8QEA0_9AGAM|nr:hypothetical protein AZE42_06299 [Rhizopogon vesiculosus]
MFCEESDLDFSLYRVDWVRQVSLFDDEQVPIHTAVLQAFDTFVNSVPKDELAPLAIPLRRTIDSTSSIGLEDEARESCVEFDEILSPHSGDYPDTADTLFVKLGL